MAYGNYNNNKDNGPKNSTYSSINFANPESSIQASRFDIGYFNRLMRLSIALRKVGNANEEYASYDNDNKISLYVSFSKAKILLDLINMMRASKNNKKGQEIHNVCIELKNGLFKVSDGTEYGLDHTCFSICYASDTGNTNEVVYETKVNASGAYNYDINTNSFNTQLFPEIELDTLVMALEEYYKASSYAIAASVMEASMYKRAYITDVINAIGEKTGVKQHQKSSYSNKFLVDSNSRNGGGNNSFNNAMNAPEGYSTSTFDDIASGME